MTDKAVSKIDDKLAELLAECEGVDMTPSDEDKAWLNSEYGREIDPVAPTQT